MTLSGALVFFTNWVKACHIGSPDWWVCCFEIDISGCTWAMTPVFGDPNVTAFPRLCPWTGSVQLVLQRPASYTWSKIHLRWRHMTRHSRPILGWRGRASDLRSKSRGFIWDHYLTLVIIHMQPELECSLSSDMARMLHFCQQWRLKPSASKTISSVFHLHNTSATRELSVYLDAQRLRHECHPTDLWGDSRLYAVLQWTKTAGKLKNQNNLLMKLSRFHLGRQRHMLWRFAIQQQSTAPQSGHVLLTQVRWMCSWTLPCASSLVPFVLHLSHGFRCSPTLNRQPYDGRLPLTSWWRKSSNMTVGQFSLIFLAHHCYDWHPGSRCG